MLASVDFDDQFVAMAGKIGEVSPNRRLAAEMSLIQRQTLQIPPELSLGISHLAA
jgi:hypothetical protein